MEDECPNCKVKNLEVCEDHKIVICFKCKWIINLEAWVLSWKYQENDI